MAAFVVNFSISSGIENEGSLFLENLKMLPTAFGEHDIIKAILPNYLGIINSSTFITEFIQRSKKLKEYANHKVEEFMKKSVITVNEDDNEVMAADLLIRNKIHHLPVLRNGYLVGPVTLRDLLKAMIEEEDNYEEEKTQ